MSIFSEIFSSSTDTLFNGISSVVKSFVRTPDEQLKADTEIQKLKIQHEETLLKIQSELETTVQNNLTERAKNDSLSDSWLSKNIRPLMLIFLTLTITVLCFKDSIHSTFSVSDSWKNVFQSAWLSVLGFYFVGRTIEKVSDIKNQK